jgi:hypothetical protein
MRLPFFNNSIGGAPTMRIARFIMLAALAGLLGSSCTIDAVQQKRDYVENVQFRLQQVDLRIHELEFLHAETQESGRLSDPQLTETLTRLGEKQQAAELKFEEVKQASAANWKGIRGSMEAVLRDLERSCDLVTFMLEEAWIEIQQSGSSPRYLLVSLP